MAAAALARSSQDKVRRIRAFGVVTGPLVSRAARATLATLGPLANASVGALRGVIRTSGTWIWTKRRTFYRGGYRLLWWGALVLLLLVGKATLTGFGQDSLVSNAHLWFAGGLALCALVLVIAFEGRMRWAAFLLGSTHGTLALLAWIAKG